MSMIGSYASITPEQLNSLIANPDSMPDLIDELAEGDCYLDIDKTWHGIHFLLNNDPWGGNAPLFNVVMGGTEIGEDMGYGPARYLRPKEVADLVDALGGISVDELKSRYNPTEFAKSDIYPQIWDEGDKALDYLLEYYPQLVSFIGEAKRNGNAVLILIT